MKQKNKGFTLAEVLITLSILGIIAAILFPSILANFTERTLKTKRAALVARMSQAMGELAGKFRNYESATNAGSYTDCTANPTHCKDTGSALKFINEGLTSVYKVSAVCDKDSLASCDIPETITRLDGSKYKLIENATSWLKYNPNIYLGTHVLKYDTDVAGFMTKNGESILLFYNPHCEGRTYGLYLYFTEIKTCVNMIYDLNGGKNKPNRLGEDVGFMSVFYETEPYVVSPQPVDISSVPDYDATYYMDGTNSVGVVNITNQYTWAEAKAACAALGHGIRLATVDEGMALQLNSALFEDEQLLDGYFWASTMVNPTQVRIIRQNQNTASNSTKELRVDYAPKDSKYFARCVYGTESK